MAGGNVGLLGGSLGSSRCWSVRKKRKRESGGEQEKEEDEWWGGTIGLEQRYGGGADVGRSALLSSFVDQRQVRGESAHLQLRGGNVRRHCVHNYEIHPWSTTITQVQSAANSLLVKDVGRRCLH